MTLATLDPPLAQQRPLAVRQALAVQAPTAVPDHAVGTAIRQVATM